MREILFKAKRTDNGEWVEGDLVHSVYKINDVCVGKYGSEIGMHQVEPDTICQFTGLLDKNGNKIWENDILKNKRLKYKVVWDEEEGSLMCESISGARYGIGKINCINFEVIGNIFDNPELLERN